MPAPIPSPEEVASARRIQVWKEFIPLPLRFPLILFIIIVYIVFGRRIHVGRLGDVGQPVVDYRRHHDGRLRLDDGTDHGLSAAVPHSVPLPAAQPAALLGRGLHRERLPVHGLRLSAAGGAALVCQRLLQDCSHLCLLEQRTAQDYPQTRLCRLLPLPLHLCAGERTTGQHRHGVQPLCLRLAGHAPHHDRRLHRGLCPGLLRHAAQLPAEPLYPVQGHRLSGRHPVEPVAALHRLHLRIRRPLRLARRRTHTGSPAFCRGAADTVHPAGRHHTPPLHQSGSLFAAQHAVHLYSA